MMESGRGFPTLVLIPTAVERARIEDQGGFGAAAPLVHLCGFGPIAAAARAAELVERLRPARVLLVGIAGTFDPVRYPVGSAAAFGAVAVEGIGAGEGAGLVGPAAMGFPQWPGGELGRLEAIHDSISLACAAHDGGRDGGLLLSTCAASGSPEQARVRRARFPDALAEDMEGFAVAFACALAGVPVSIVRGASNPVGDRDPARWRIPAALGAARVRALELLCAGERAL
jgi:futalosine hydrolase